MVGEAVLGDLAALAVGDVGGGDVDEVRPRAGALEVLEQADRAEGVESESLVEGLLEGDRRRAVDDGVDSRPLGAVRQAVLAEVAGDRPDPAAVAELGEGLGDEHLVEQAAPGLVVGGRPEQHDQPLDPLAVAQQRRQHRFAEEPRGAR